MLWWSGVTCAWSLTFAAGEHREVAIAAEALAAADPVRERRWATLALARYRCGRQADALQRAVAWRAGDTRVVARRGGRVGKGLGTPRRGTRAAVRWRSTPAGRRYLRPLGGVGHVRHPGRRARRTDAALAAPPVCWPSG